MREVTAIIKLSDRLGTIASFLPRGVFFADIGSDHAYLPCYICQRDRHAKAIAGEINKGPYKKALETVKSLQLESQIIVRLGNGLEVIRTENITHVIIAGMGGELIERILADGKEELHLTNRIIAQPNVATDKVRNWFYQNEFEITYETMIEENSHIYEVVVADRDNNVSAIKEVTNKQLLFGPLLLQRKSHIFYKKWKIEYEKINHIINQMKQASVINVEKLADLNKKKSWIEEVLVDENTNC